MKLLIVLLVIFLSSALYGQGGWILQESGTTVNLRSISSYDGVNIIAVGEGGIILLSTNYGVRWTELPSPTHETLNGVAALSGKVIASSVRKIPFITQATEEFPGIRQKAVRAENVRLICLLKN